ncbi:MAG: alpha-L-arabinofuranosidase [Chryseobacterium sp.]|nr:alpha-L-arabinofuranosidase [Chryseobacterium sp.]MBP7499843.1 alpha-L-arabinofuranosidase [Chryseobacterium sp.]
MIRVRHKMLVASIALLSSATIWAQNSKHTLELDGSSTNIKIQPTMYGVFFEDINQGADGGLYAELVKNRSFEFYNPLMGWTQPKGDLHSENKNSGYANIVTDKNKSNHNYARVTINNDKNYELINEGFKGMGLHKGSKYNFSFLSEKASGNIHHIKADLIDEQGNVVGSANIALDKNGFQKYDAVITPSKTVEKGKLKLTFEGNGVLNLDMVSLFPQETWNNRPNGLRKDLVQKLYDLKPGFVRFPGGCIVEGRTLAERYQWKKTVGNIADREILINRWNTEFAHRPAPDYFQSFGLGFFEYFQLSEDLGAEPLPILSCGIACQFNTGELVPIGDIDTYVQDALDLIEFANGDQSTAWGKVRADMGHPKPFNLKYIGVGNEQWGPDYIERYKIFEKAIKSKYPNMIIISGSGPFEAGEYFDYGWDELKKLNAEIIDEHYYKTPQWFQENAKRYDNYDRKGPKVFAGEYAAQTVAIASPDNKNSWETALSEAAFMTGLERNADVVYMTSYAPLLAHAEGWQWTPDLIWFNNLSSYVTPNYYVQKLFSNNRGTDVIKISENGKAVTGDEKLYASAVVDKNSKETIIKIVNTDSKSKEININSKNLKWGKNLIKTTLSSSSLSDENNFSLENIKPKSENISVKSGNLSTTIPANSLVVLKIK